MPDRKSKQSKTTQDACDAGITTEQARAIVKKKNRGSDWMKELKADSGEPGENSRFVRHALVAWNLPPIDISDPKQVEHRIGEYFKYCAENDLKPQIVGLCNWIGISRDTLNSWIRGECRTSTHSDIIKKAVAFIEGMWADYMQAGKLNPATGIFLAKNWYGYKDVADVVVTPNNPYQAASDDELRGKYLADVPDEDE